MIPIAVFASGRGSNLGAILKAIREGRLEAEVVAVVSDRAEAGALELARDIGIAALFIPPAALTLMKATASAPANAEADLEVRRRAHEEEILDRLQPFAPRFLVMAGYMKVVTERLIAAFRSERGYSRIINVHPSLLPSFAGVGAYEQAFRHGAKVTGVTVHLVERKVDDGPICAQEAFSIADCITAAEVERRGLVVEHRLFPDTLNWVLRENFVFEERGYPRRFCVSTN